MVQRMLTAPDAKKSKFSLILSGFADIPIVVAFLSIGILLWVYYGQVPDPSLPVADNEVFAHFIVTQMPVGFRGLIIAGVFATMMGSTSAALNALATSFTKDFYLPYFRKSDGGEAAVIRAARIATAVFGGLMVIVATAAAYAVLHDPKLTIIPIAIGILGYTYGALLGVFLLGMLTRNRGWDPANAVAMFLGIAAVMILCRVEIKGLVNFGLIMPSWWPVISWPWYVLVGCVVCLAVSLLFRTPEDRVHAARLHVENASGAGDEPQSG
jgi:Na+/proline symporter